MKVGGEVLFSLGLVTLKVHIPKVHVEAGLGVNGCNDDETALGRPVDRVAVLLLKGPDQLEASQEVALLLRGKERHSCLGCDGSTCRGFSRGDDDKTATVGFPSEVDHGVLEHIDNLDRNTLFTHTENFEVGSQ